ncbi:MAG: preprotein translocase subunit SecG [Bacteroidetes bacterium]|nr:MAG: preprotein translocase subunit SecG [Bacteroidota bacterium]
MMIFFVILIVLACVFLGLIILVQNPKGGGLAGNVAGFSNQFMGVKQTTDVLEKGTWILAVVVVLLSLFSTIFIPKSAAVQFRDAKPTTNSMPANPGTLPSNSGNQQQLPADNNQAPPAQSQPAKK